MFSDVLRGYQIIETVKQISCPFHATDLFSGGTKRDQSHQMG